MNILNAVLSSLTEHEEMSKFSNLALTSHKLDNLSEDERRLFAKIFYTVIERKITYDYYILSLASRTDVSPRAKNILRIGACLILDIDSISEYAAVNESVKLAKSRGERAFVNAVLRELIRRKGSLPMPERERNVARYLSVKYSFSRDIVKHFLGLYGEEFTESLLSYFNTARYTDISVNLNKISRDEFLKKLRLIGIDASPSLYSQIGVRISGSINPCRIPGYNEGEFFVQDEASCVLCEALEPGENMRIIDVCSAPGGKTLAAASLSLDKSEIFAFDIKESKLSLITDSVERLGLKSVKVAELDATNPKQELFGTADRVIVDAPCSGLGILSKKSDLRYKDISGISKLCELQYEILNKSKNYVKPGGILTYSTCTLNVLENEKTVERFLNENPDFSPLDFSVGSLASENGSLTLYPHIHKTDGFFIAKLRRKDCAKA